MDNRGARSAQHARAVQLGRHGRALETNICTSSIGEACAGDGYTNGPSRQVAKALEAPDKRI